MEPLPDLEEAFNARYRPIRVLGRGGMGLVVEARDATTGRPVAVKFLTGDLRPEITERFLREGKLMAQVEHAHVARIFDMDTMRGQPFLVMELLTGGSLRERMAKGPIAVKEATRILMEVLEGLAACHAHKLVHRDVKPENILFDAEGAARITDLGVALLDSEVSRLTKTGAFIGTPAYAAPEMFEEQDATAAADVYAMGLIYYEMIAGKPPFEMSSLNALIQQRLRARIPEPAALGAAVPMWAWKVIQKAIARKPADRPRDAAEMAAFVREAATNTSMRMKRPGPVTRSKPTPRPEPASNARAPIVVGALVALLAVGALALPALRPGKQPVVRSPMSHELSVIASRTKARITWKTLVPSGSRLLVWSTEEGESRARRVPEADGEPALLHQLDVPDLDPKKSYRFRIEGEPEESVSTLEPARGVPLLAPDYSLTAAPDHPLLHALCELPYRLYPRISRQRFSPGEKLLNQLTADERARVADESRALVRAEFRPTPSMNLERWLAAVPYWLADPGFDSAERARIYAMAAELLSVDAIGLHTAGVNLFDVQKHLDPFVRVVWGAPKPQGVDLMRGPAFAPALKLFPAWVAICEQRGVEFGDVFSTMVPWKEGGDLFRSMAGVMQAVVKSPPESRVALWHALDELPAAGPVTLWLSLADVDPSTRLWLRFGRRVRVPIGVPRIDPKAPKELSYIKPPELLDRMERHVAVTLPAGFLAERDRAVELGGEYFLNQVKPRDVATRFFWLRAVIAAR